MLPEPHTRRDLRIGRALSCLAITLCTSLLAHGQDTEQQLQQLKEQLETTTRQMEQRISALEQQLEKEKNAKTQTGSDERTQETKSRAKASVAQIQQEFQKSVVGESNEVGAKFPGQVPSEPSYDLLREADKKIEELQEREGAFEFHGYFRSGFG
jgi:maltoporin